MYKAIKEIGGYKIGEEVPDRLAELWLDTYDIPHVEKSEKNVSEKKKSEEKPKKVEEKKVDSYDNILEDYLDRNQSVVKKNLHEDNLSKNQLKGMLKIEQKDKKRPLILDSIKRLLKN